MTKDDIIKLAREVESEVGFQWCVNFIELERFASLVSKHEREACAVICEAQDEYGWQQYTDAIRARGNT